MAQGRGRLQGKVAIVTGAGSSGPGVGNGKATAVLFAREGAKVLLADHVEARARETLEIIQGEGGTASVFEGDVTVLTIAAQWWRRLWRGMGGWTCWTTTWGYPIAQGW